MFYILFVLERKRRDHIKDSFNQRNFFCNLQSNVVTWKVWPVRSGSILSPCLYSLVNVKVNKSYMFSLLVLQKQIDCVCAKITGMYFHYFRKFQMKNGNLTKKLHDKDGIFSLLKFCLCRIIVFLNILVNIAKIQSRILN